MKVSYAVNYFGSKVELARVLGICRQTVYSWNDIIPLDKAAVLYFATEGRLRLNIRDYGYYIKNL